MNKLDWQSLIIYAIIAEHSPISKNEIYLRTFDLIEDGLLFSTIEDCLNELEEEGLVKTKGEFWLVKALL